MLFKILGICLITAVFTVVLRQKSGEYAFLLTVAAGVTIGLLLLNSLFAPIRELSGYLAKQNVDLKGFKVALKAVGIGYITSFVSEACKDCGQNLLALKAELAGKCAIFLLSVPLMISVLETAVGFIK